MTRTTTPPLWIAMALGSAMIISSCSGFSDAPTEADIDIADEIKGPHGGRLLTSGDFDIEVTIYETGVEPQFRLYAYLNDTLLDPSSVQATLQLKRLGDVIDDFEFTPEDDYLRGHGIVTEPHSFVVSVSARHDGRSHNWSYDSLEGRTEIANSVAEAAGIETEIAGPATVGLVIPVTGQVAFAPDAIAAIKSPYTGRVLSLTKSVGDTVSRGETLARLENVSTLQGFSITAPKDGVILERRSNVGDVARDEPLFVIGDMSDLEAHLHVFPTDQARVRQGMPVRIKTPMGEAAIETSVAAFLPTANRASQTLVARAPMPSTPGLVPGMRLSAEVVVDTIEAPLAVRTSGLQRFRDFAVIFAKVDETYEVRMLELGAQDRDWVEVRGGLEPGTEYVTRNAFLLKADVEKDGASHDH